MRSKSPNIVGFLLLLFAISFFVYFPLVTGIFSFMRRSSFMQGAGGVWPPGLMGLFPMGLPLFFFVLSIVIAAWVFNDAEKRGMNGWLWGLLVFFANIIGLVVYLLARNEGIPARPITREACSQCGRPLQPDFLACPYCGAKVKQTCPQCGKVVRTEWKVCPYCAAEL